MTPNIFDSKKQFSKTHYKKKKVSGSRTAQAMISKKTSFRKANTKRTKSIDEYSEIMRQEKPTTSNLVAYAPKPTRVGFDSQLKEEEVILLLRQHPITQWKNVVVTVGAIFAPGLLLSTPFLNFLPIRFHVGFVMGWYLLLIGFVLESFLIWFFNVYIITDERIIDVDFLSLIFKNISSAKLDHIEDITVTTAGFLPSVVNYGTIKIQTAAEKTEFEFDAVPKPNRVVALLNELLIEEEREKIEGRVN